MEAHAWVRSAIVTPPPVITIAPPGMFETPQFAERFPTAANLDRPVPGALFQEPVAVRRRYLKTWLDRALDYALLSPLRGIFGSKTACVHDLTEAADRRLAK